MAIRPKRPRDANQLAKIIVDMSIGDSAIEQAPSNRQLASQKGGLKGGPKRANQLSPKRRSEIAKKAAQGRWKKTD